MTFAIFVQNPASISGCYGHIMHRDILVPYDLHGSCKTPGTIGPPLVLIVYVLLISALAAIGVLFALRVSCPRLTHAI